MPFRDPQAIRDYQNEWKKRRRQEWINSQGGKCVKCGSTDDLQVDHITRVGKVAHNIWSWSKARREAELIKCQVLCGPCHQEKTNEENRSHIHGTPGMYRRCKCDTCRAGNTARRRKIRASHGSTPHQPRALKAH